MSRLTAEWVKMIKSLHRDNFSNRSIARCMGISRRTVGRLIQANFNHKNYTLINRVKKEPFVGMLFSRVKGKVKVVYAKEKGV